MFKDIPDDQPKFEPTEIFSHNCQGAHLCFGLSLPLALLIISYLPQSDASSRFFVLSGLPYLLLSLLLTFTSVQCDGQLISTPRPGSNRDISPTRQSPLFLPSLLVTLPSQESISEDQQAVKLLTSRIFEGGNRKGIVSLVF